jgi:preprotein translocase subunit SecF
MKRILRFSKFFIPAAIISFLLAVLGVAGYVLEGFNMGVDFQAGMIQEVQFAPPAFEITYSGISNASITISRTNITIVISGAGINEAQYDFPFARYTTVNDLVQGISSIENVSAVPRVSGDVQSSALVQSAYSSPELGTSPFILHYLDPNAKPVTLEDIRSSLLPLGTVSVQVLGESAERRFMIRTERFEDRPESNIPPEKIIATLEASFGKGSITVSRSDSVNESFSKQLADQAGILLGFTLLLILIYSSIRFKPQYALGAVLAIIHDGLIIVAFVVWTRMEFNTTTIAAILTILGYSINDTIVIFDRIRETRRIYPEENFVTILDRSISETLGRTIITTLTTMLAVVSLYVFTTGSMQDFARALLVGMLSGVYSTIFIACGFVNFWESRKIKNAAGKKPQPEAALKPVKAR